MAKDILYGVDDIREVVGYRKHLTPNGTHIPAVFYDVVREYHDCIKNGDMEALFNFEVSVDTASTVAGNIRALVSSLNNGSVPVIKNEKEIPDAWKLLPTEIYDVLDSSDLKLVSEQKSSIPKGTAKHREFLSLYEDFADTLTDFIVEAYDLPHSANYAEENLERSLALSGVPEEAVGKKAGLISFLSKTPVPIVSTTIPGVTSIFPFVAGNAILGSVFLFAGGVAGVVTSVIMAELDSFSYEKMKGHWAYGLGRKNFKRNFVEYDQVVQPYLASMEKFLVQENKNVDVILSETDGTFVFEKEKDIL